MADCVSGEGNATGRVRLSVCFHSVFELSDRDLDFLRVCGSCHGHSSAGIKNQSHWSGQGLEIGRKSELKVTGLHFPLS